MAEINFADITLSNSDECYGVFNYSATIVVIIISCVVGIAWAIINFLLVKKIDVMGNSASSSSNLVDNITEEQRKLLIELG